MTGNLVITIGRECGSGGRLIGNRLAEKLNIKCYDKELLTLAAKKSGLCEEIFESHDEKPTSSFLYSLVMDSYSMGYSTSSFIDMPLNHKVFLAQFDTIKHLADTESCVIVGRCADYALNDLKNCVHIFIYGDEETLKNITSIPVKINVEKLDKNTEYNVNLSKPSGVKEMSISTVVVKVTLTSTNEKTVDGVLIETRNLDSGYSAQAASASDSTVSVIVKGTNANINAIKKEDIHSGIFFFS